MNDDDMNDDDTNEVNELFLKTEQFMSEVDDLVDKFSDEKFSQSFWYGAISSHSVWAAKELEEEKTKHR